MATGKKFYWIKLKDSFLASDKVDYLMSQKDGANYVVLYQMLCLKTINTGGEFARQIGEVIIPYDAEKIQRDCKYFPIDTIYTALNLYKALGMVYEQENGILKIADLENMVGSETDYAEQKKRQRLLREDKTLLESGHNVDNGVDNVHIENRDKILENRDKILDIREEENRDKDIIERVGEKEKKSSRFSPPTIDQIKDYCCEKNYPPRVAEPFFNYYDSKNWYVGKNKMTNWHSALAGWVGREKEFRKEKVDSVSKVESFV